MSLQYYIAKIRTSLIIMICVICVPLSAQNSTIDSLKLALKNAKHDSTKCKTLKLLFNLETNDDVKMELTKQRLQIAESNLSKNNKTERVFFLMQKANCFNNFGFIYLNHSEHSKALEYYLKGLKIYEEIRDKKSVGRTLGNIAFMYSDQADYTKALEYYLKGLKISEELGDKKSIGRNLSNIAGVYIDQANYPKALDCFLKGIKICEEVGDKSLVGNASSGIAAVYYAQRDYPKALEYHLKGLNIGEEIRDKQMIGKSICGMASVYFAQANHTKALEYYLKGLKLFEEMNDKQMMGRTLSNIAGVYSARTDYHNALDYQLRSLKLVEERGNKLQVGGNLANVGSLYTLLGKYKEAELNLKKALSITISIGAEDYEKLVHSYLTKLYEKTHRPALALEHYKKYISLGDTIFSKENSKKLMRTEMDHEYDKKKAVADAEHELEIKNQKLIAFERNKKQNIIIASIVTGLLLVIIFAVFVFRSLRVTNKQKKLIELKNIETEQQKKEIETKQEEILDSIKYARRIQMAQIPSEKMIARSLEKLRK